MYSLGVTLYTLLVGYPPFVGRTAEEILQETVNKPTHYIEEDWDSISDDALLLVKGMLAKNPTDRYSMKEVMSCRWVTHPPLCGMKDNTKRLSLSGRQFYRSLSVSTTLPGNGVHPSFLYVYDIP